MLVPDGSPALSLVISISPGVATSIRVGRLTGSGGRGFRALPARQAGDAIKQPRIGGEVSLHSNATFLYTDPITVRGFWFALEDANRENGCMWALPGGHSIPLKDRFHRLPTGGASFEVFDPTPYPTEGLVPLEAPKGTLVLLHGLLPHTSGPNRSERSRHAYTLHAIERDAHYPADNWLQP